MMDQQLVDIVFMFDMINMIGGEIDCQEFVMSDTFMVKVIVDGIEVEVLKGMIIFNVVQQVGVEIFIFCYYFGLLILVNC